MHWSPYPKHLLHAQITPVNDFSLVRGEKYLIPERKLPKLFMMPPSHYPVLPPNCVSLHSCYIVLPCSWKLPCWAHSSAPISCPLFLFWITYSSLGLSSSTFAHCCVLSHSLQVNQQTTAPVFVIHFFLLFTPRGLRDLVPWTGIKPSLCSESAKF